MIRQLQPWYSSTKKRLVKSPKIYFRDSGIFHALLNITNFEQLNNNPKLGSSWEGFALEQCIQKLELLEDEAYFGALHSGAEMDLVFQHQGQLCGIEVKYSDRPKISKSIISAQAELDLAKVFIVYPGQEAAFQMSDKVTALSLGALSENGFELH